MKENVYKKIELTGASPISIDNAVNTAIAKSAQTVRNMRWFEVTEIRGTINEDRVDSWQVSIKVGFTIED
jgi:flavin-binding protein dodecin